MPAARRLLITAVFTLILTAGHHIYGGVLYATPWRVHGAVVALVLAGVIAWLHRRRAVRLELALVAVVCVVGIGLFEGLYNHVVKDALYLAHAPRRALLRMFPPPTYEPPGDPAFELSGVAEALAGGATAVAALRVAAARRGARTRRSAGTVLAPRALVSVTGEPIALPDPVQLTHLQFRRFAGCPICNLHLQRFRARHTELLGAGIREVVVFHSPPAELRAHAGQLPFAVIADPDRRLYAELGVEAGVRSLLDPRVWPTLVRAIARSTLAILRGRERPPSLVQRAGRLGLPADFLIDSDGRIVACKYGDHASDQWSVDQVLAASAAMGASRCCAPIA
ncbi:MAG TPA: peroxiredoxin-like family protein [Kofleriaceae bacterium]|nr:peroxiredoxin-like family protein [Kofleriaceae bacterium]